MSTLPEIGKEIVHFCLKNQNEEEVCSKNWKGKKVVIYFYPKDDTPGCTTQACDLRDNYNRLLEQGYLVFGVSPDSAQKHQKFIEKYNLPFDLLVDEDHSFIESWGCWKEKNMYGKKYWGVARTTFIIDEEGILQEIISKVKTKEHTAQILG